VWGGLVLLRLEVLLACLLLLLLLFRSRACAMIRHAVAAPSSHSKNHVRGCEHELYE